MNKARKIATGAALLGALVGGWALTAAAPPTNAATTATPTDSPSAGTGTHGNETELTGDTAAKVKAAVLAANTGATVERMTTEDDGTAAYEAHITKTDGTRAEVKLDSSFKITTTETDGPGH